MTKSSKWPLLALGFLLCAPTHAAVLYTDFGPGDTYNSGGDWIIGGANLFSIAAPFSPAVTGFMTDVRLAVFHGSGVNGHYLVEVTNDSAGSPGSVIESFTGVTFPAAGGIITLASALTPLLSAGTNYWVTVSDPFAPDSQGGWYLNNQGLNGLMFENSTHANWTANADVTTPAFAIDGRASSVPEPGTVSMIVGGLIIAVSLKLRR